MARKIFLPLLGVAIAAGSGWAGWVWWNDWRHLETTDDAYVHADITVIRPKVAGHVVALAAEDNRPVAHGDVLLRLDDRDARVRLAQARAGVAARRAALVRLDAQVTVQRSIIAGTAAARDAAQAGLTLARQELTRATSLQSRDIASRQRLETAQADLAKAEAGMRSAEAAQTTAERQLDLLAAERGVADAELRRAEAEQAAADIALDDTVIRAPIAGLVGNRGVQLGDFVTPGAHLLALVPLDRVYVEANFKETQIAGLRPGQVARLAVDAFPGQTIHGAVDSFAPASGAVFSLLPPENATGNFTKVVQRIPVRIRVPEPAGLRPGMSVVVTIDTRGNTRGDGATAVPIAAK